MSRICRNMGDLWKLRFYELDHESKMRLLKTHSHTSNGLAIWSPYHAKKSRSKQRRPDNKANVTHQKPAACRRCGGGGAEKALEPAACRRCGGGGEERLYGKPSKEKVLWRGDPLSIWTGT